LVFQRVGRRRYENRRGVAIERGDRRRRTRSQSGSATPRSSAPATSSSRARVRPCSARVDGGGAAHDRIRSRKNAIVDGSERRGRNCREANAESNSTRRMWKRRAADAGIRVTPSNRKRLIQGCALGSRGQRDARGRVRRIRQDESREHYRTADRRWGCVNICPRRGPRRWCISPGRGAGGQEHRVNGSSRKGACGRYPPEASSRRGVCEDRGLYDRRRGRQQMDLRPSNRRDEPAARGRRGSIRPRSGHRVLFAMRE